MNIYPWMQSINFHYFKIVSQKKINLLCKVYDPYDVTIARNVMSLCVYITRTGRHATPIFRTSLILPSPLVMLVFAMLSCYLSVKPFLKIWLHNFSLCFLSRPTLLYSLFQEWLFVVARMRKKKNVAQRKNCCGWLSSLVEHNDGKSGYLHKPYTFTMARLG